MALWRLGYAYFHSSTLLQAAYNTGWLAKVEDAPMERQKRDVAADLIAAIKRNTGWCQSEIGHWMNVAQATISRWTSGSLVPSDEDLMRLHFLSRITSEKALLLGAGMLAAVERWYFLCARAPTYHGVQKSLAEKALADLVGAVQASTRRYQKIEGLCGFGFLCSVVAFAVPFPDASRSFTFGDDMNQSRRFVVLVNAALTPQEQEVEVSMELSAHVRPHLVEHDGDIRAKGRLI